MNNIQKVIDAQREFFRSGKTLDVSFRVQMLKKLYSAIQKYEGKINDALKKDLGKSAYESYMCEVGLSLSEIRYLIKHTPSYAKKKKVHTPISQFLSSSYVLPSPYGNTLVISPWNYPILLAIEPIADAMAAGNTAILKPSELSPNVSNVLAEMIKENFPEGYLAVVLGGPEVATELLEQKHDFIFYTGSVRVGQIILQSTVKNLTPCVLELGGKSPCIVEKSAAIPLTAKRIVFGKYLNCGQTCVAPDYILCDKSILNEFVDAVKKEIVRQFGQKPLENKDYGRIVSARHYQRLMSLIDANKIAFGGKGNPDTLQIEPTVMTNVTLDDAVMGEEIFGPILPIIAYEKYSEVYETIAKRPTPLALYIFSRNKKIIDETLSSISFGGGCVNDVIIHLANSEMGFGGVGTSGMGSYHGKVGFDVFSHQKNIVDKKLVIDLPLRYQPYKPERNEKLLRRVLH